MPKSTFTRSTDTAPKKEPKGIIWGVILLLALGFTGLKVIPTFNDWNAKSQEMATLEQELPDMKDKLSEEKEKLKEIENEFARRVEPFKIEEEKLLPDEIDVDVYSKVLELYAEQISTIENSLFEITQLSFGGSSNVQGGNYASTDLTITFEGTEKMLRDFVFQLQRGDIVTPLKSAETTGLTDRRAFKFVEKYGFPIVQIDSINTSPAGSEETSDRLNASMSIRMFSKRLKNET